MWSEYWQPFCLGVNVLISDCMCNDMAMYLQVWRQYWRWQHSWRIRVVIRSMFLTPRPSMYGTPFVWCLYLGRWLSMPSSTPMRGLKAKRQNADRRGTLSWIAHWWVVGTHGEAQDIHCCVSMQISLMFFNRFDNEIEIFDNWKYLGGRPSNDLTMKGQLSNI